MKSKIKRGKDFSGLCRYILRKSAQPDLIGGNLCGTNPADLANEFQQVANLRPQIEKPVWHGSLALPKGDQLTDQQWNKVVTDYLQGLGFNTQTTPYAVVRHRNTQSDHVHIAVSRVSLSGKLYLGRNEHLIATQLCQKLEQAHGLTITPGPDHKAPAKALKTTEKAMQQRTGKVPPRHILQQAIYKIINEGSNLSVDEFIKKLGEVGITAKPNASKSGKMSGFSFQINGIAFKASQLGKAYGWKALEKRLQPHQQVKATPAPEAPKPVFVPIRDKADRAEVAENSKKIKLLTSELWQANKKAKRRKGIISRIINWRRQQIYNKEIEQLKRRNAEIRAKADARIMAPAAPPANKVEYDQMITDFCRLQVSKDKVLQQLNANQKACELYLHQTTIRLASLQSHRAELLATGKKQGWGPNTPPPPIWQPLQRKAHAVWILELSNISSQLIKQETLEIQQKQAVEHAKTAARYRTQDVWSQAMREVEARPQMTDFIKQNKVVKSKKQVTQRGAQGLSL